MNPYIIAFITGLTTGGLSCLAVQGGLLATSLARQIEQDMLALPKSSTSSSRRTGRPASVSHKQAPEAVRPNNASQAGSRTALPIALFLSAKVIAYTLLGFLLGALGSVLTLNATARAILLIAIGIFMIGNGLRMLNVHPIFRYFAIEPPKFITRYIRRTAKNSTDLVTPLFLGALTVLIPCGVTQAMMAVAIASGSAMQGAGLMLAFTLGTSPVFFLVAYLTTRLGARLEKLFMSFVAVVVLALGIFAIFTGLNLAGAPVPVANWMQNLFAPPQAIQQVDTPSPAVEADTTLTMNAKNNGYFPHTLYAKAEEPVKLNVVTQNTRSCAVAFVIPDLNYETLLPTSGITPIDIPPQKTGTVMPFTCSMGMYSGEIVFK
jgi:sulfite exporter TauE/SafE